MSTISAGLSMPTVRNHFVPQFASRPWLQGKDHFWSLSCKNLKVRLTAEGPRSWGYEPNLYSQKVENAFCKIEGRIAPLQAKLSAGQQLTDDQRNAWSMWLLACYLRTPESFLRSADARSATSGFPAALFDSGYSILAHCAADPHCIALITNREWKVVTHPAPRFLRPDSGVIITDRLDSDACSILYPLTPTSCFVASGTRLRFSGIIPASGQTITDLNTDILRWSDRSAICTVAHWEQEESILRNAVSAHFGKGQFFPPTSGRFFSIATAMHGDLIRTTLLAPRGPFTMEVSSSAIRPTTVADRAPIPGLYEIKPSRDIAIGVRYSDNEDEIDYTSVAQEMIRRGRSDLALEFANKARQKDEANLLAKLLVVNLKPNANVGSLTPRDAKDAALLADWYARAQNQPLEGLKITSSWMADNSDDANLIGINFLCAFMVYGPRLFLAMTKGGEKLPYLEDWTPLPQGAIELRNKILSHKYEGNVAAVQRQLGHIAPEPTGLAADILSLCGLADSVVFYHKV